MKDQAGSTTNPMTVSGRGEISATQAHECYFKSWSRNAGLQFCDPSSFVCGGKVEL